MLRIFGVMNVIFILSCSFNIQGREHYLHDFVENNFNVGFYLNIDRPIPFKFGMMIVTTKFYILISVWMTWTLFKVTFVWEMKNFCVQCVRNVPLDLDKI